MEDKLNELNIRVIRFTNGEVMTRLSFVLNEIEGRLIPVNHLIPGPCPQGEGRQSI